MRLPSSYLHFGPIQTQNVIVGTSHKQDQADRAKELKMWIKQQEETLQAMYGEGVEILPSPLLLEEMECLGVSDWVPVDVLPDQNHTSPACSSSKRRRPRRKRSTPATAELNLLTAASPEPSTSAAAPAEPSSSAAAPAAAEIPAGFGSRPGRRRRRGTVAIGRLANIPENKLSLNGGNILWEVHPVFAKLSKH
ncbi:hypothetical protein XENOCAPTIV_026781 [Xenoophorus captivus]|uniref:Uncharacterized protein n=1 Tax=Xenoophorus captivus TaxID=1517983 RepID=A0ABV0SA03_9TELE